MLICLCGSTLKAQKPVYRPLKVLFLGNSYTYVNSLPQVTADIAASMGDSLTYDSNTIGGYTLQQHANDATSLAKIAAGDLDYVVLQEQSQWPSFPADQVDTGMFPYAHFLDSLNHTYNTCGGSMFYMTWGRKNGDDLNCPTWPPVCTYEGMDSMLRLRYMMMADSNAAVLSPVGAVWHYIRQQYPAIELYQADESHPSPAGTYAAACAFYTALFHKNPENIAYDYSLGATDATNIRHAAKVIVYDSMLYWHIGQYDPSAVFSYSTAAGNEVTFTNTSVNAASYTWYFGDGDTATTASPAHTYTVPGVYTVILVAHRCNDHDTFSMDISTWPAHTSTLQSGKSGMVISPNPAGNSISVQLPVAGQAAYGATIFNLQGVTVYRAALAGMKDYRIDISSLAPGFYILSLRSNDGSLWRGLFMKK